MGYLRYSVETRKMVRYAIANAPYACYPAEP